MRGKINLKEAAIIVANVRPELKPCEKLLIKVALHPSVVKKVVLAHEGHENVSTGELIVPKITTEKINVDRQEPSGSNSSGSSTRQKSM